jgi:hypothetical protein
MGEDRELDGVVTYVNGEPFEGLKDATLELEPANPDDLPEAPELPELTLKITPEGAAAIVESLKSVHDKAVQALQQLLETMRNASAVVCEKASKLIEAEMYYSNDNPRWWHLYKHAKKARTRKKYRRLLMKQLLRNLRDAEKKKEANT